MSTIYIAFLLMQTALFFTQIHKNFSILKLFIYVRDTFYLLLIGSQVACVFLTFEIIQLKFYIYHKVLTNVLLNNVTIIKTHFPDSFVNRKRLPYRKRKSETSLLGCIKNQAQNLLQTPHLHYSHLNPSYFTTVLYHVLLLLCYLLEQRELLTGCLVLPVHK